MRGKRSSGATATLVSRPRSLAEAVGVEENPDFTFDQLLQDLRPIAEKLRTLLKETGEEEEEEDTSPPESLTPLADAAFVVWTDLFDHYHETRSWTRPSAFDGLLWAVADLAQELEDRLWPGVESKKAPDLLTAIEHFQATRDAFYQIADAPTPIRDRTSSLAD